MLEFVKAADHQSPHPTLSSATFEVRLTESFPLPLGDARSSSSEGQVPVVRNFSLLSQHTNGINSKGPAVGGGSVAYPSSSFNIEQVDNFANKDLNAPSALDGEYSSTNSPFLREHSPSSVQVHSPLFEPMDDNSLDVRAATPSTIHMSSAGSPYIYEGTSPTSFDVGPDPNLQRARAMKSELLQTSRVFQVANKKPRRKPVEEDHENILIKEFRTKHHMGWGAIAEYLNQERLKRGEAAKLTDAAVYSRFARNAKRVAAARGEVGFDPQDYMHMRHLNNHPTETVVTARKRGRGEFEADNKDKEEVIPKEVKGNVRKRNKLVEECQELERPERLAMLAEAVEVVERNFWVFVADELERTTGKLYDEKVIESCYKTL